MSRNQIIPWSTLKTPHFLWRKIAWQIIFCLPLLFIVFYFQNHHTETINNTNVSWQYVSNANGQTFLALDVYAPSGIKDLKIFSSRKDVTSGWELLNYPQWYKKSNQAPNNSSFRELVQPYFPDGPEENHLFPGNGYYTFLYEWINKSAPIPADAKIKIQYKDIGTDNDGIAKHLKRAILIPHLKSRGKNNFQIGITVLLPDPKIFNNSRGGIPKTFSLTNLAFDPSASGFILQDPSRNNYIIRWQESRGKPVGQIIGTILSDGNGLTHFFEKNYLLPPTNTNNWRDQLTSFLEHLMMLLFLIYLILICRATGKLLSQHLGLQWEDPLEKHVIILSLGILILTYFFFGLGILKLLYPSIVASILVTILLFGTDAQSVFSKIRLWLTTSIPSIFQSPWKIIMASLLGTGLFYNLIFCFLPATYISGSGDIVNSYLPNINQYLISHSFRVPIENSTTGIVSQSTEVLRTIAALFIGEPGIYLVTFLHLLLMLSAFYLIGKKIFNISPMFTYLTLTLLISSNVFTEVIHLGKTHIILLAFILLLFLTIRQAKHPKNYLLPGFFLAFLTSSNIHFIVLAFVYYSSVFLLSFIESRRLLNPLASRTMKSFLVFCALAFVFNLKLILETGICFPPGMIPSKLADIFLRFNQGNDFYRFIDNNYIRNFYAYSHLAMNANELTWDKLISKFIQIKDLLNYWYILLLVPFVIRFNQTKILFMLLTGSLMILITAIYPAPTRMTIYYLYLLILLQFAVVGDLAVRINNVLPSSKKAQPDNLKTALSLIIFSLMLISFNESGLGIRKMAFLEYNKCAKSQSQSAAEIFLGKLDKYQYLNSIKNDDFILPPAEFPDSDNFDYCLLIRQFTTVEDTILIVPVRFHSHTNRKMTARHALGSVIYQKDVKKIMADLEQLKIGYLSVMPILYPDFNPFYTPIFEDQIFYRYFKLLFSYKGRNFYRIIYDGSNKEYTPPPYNVSGLPFVPMIK